MASVFNNPTKWFAKSENDMLVVEGGEALRDRLKALAKGIDVDLAEEALLEAADPMRQRAAALAPRAAGAGHGAGGAHLADNILLAAKAQEPGAATINVGMEKHVWYGRFWEFGTRWIAARPFLRPAFDAEEAGTVQRWGDRLRQKITEYTESAGA